MINNSENIANLLLRITNPKTFSTAVLNDLSIALQVDPENKSKCHSAIAAGVMEFALKLGCEQVANLYSNKADTKNLAKFTNKVRGSNLPAFNENETKLLSKAEDLLLSAMTLAGLDGSKKVSKEKHTGPNYNKPYPQLRITAPPGGGALRVEASLCDPITGIPIAYLVCLESAY